MRPAQRSPLSPRGRFADEAGIGPTTGTLTPARLRGSGLAGSVDAAHRSCHLARSQRTTAWLRAQETRRMAKAPNESTCVRLNVLARGTRQPAAMHVDAS